MRKYQKRQIMELLQIIAEAQAAGLYADCQEGALTVGKFIANTVGEGTHTVSLLESYCELLYKANNGEADDAQLTALLAEIKSCAETELPAKKYEIVFFPYSASMWDSLESIYLAAAADPECDVFVVPIPYYGRKSNGELAEMHCEGDQYPEGIPITNWRDYDVEEIRPDVIYVHNQYDDSNAITSVHPDYYSSRLKDLTDLLVYVPYGLPSHLVTLPTPDGGKVPASEGSNLPAYRNFDLIIRHSVPPNPNARNVALGSPKYDKVLSARREDYTLPEAWRRTINGRKVVLYNTSIGAMLALPPTSTAYLDKLRRVMEDFADREDLVLWWRPHPLFVKTVYSVRQSLSEVNLLIDRFKSGDFAIYDDSPDLYRALTMSDAYYGDMSSLVNLYGLTGKPIVLQQVEMAPVANPSTAPAWELPFEKRKAGEKTTADYLIPEQPAPHGAYSFLSGYLREHTQAPGEKETFAAAFVNADGTVGTKAHAHVMARLKEKQKARATT